MPKASVLIRTKNEEATIDLVLRKVFEQKEKDLEVVVIDSGSTDRTLEIVAGHPARLIKIDPARFTYGRALNEGFKVCTAPILVSLSAHAVPFDRDWLSNMIEPFEDPDVCAVVGKPLPHPDCNPFDRRGLLRRYGTEKLYLHRDSEITYSNANAAVRRLDWEKTPFDEDLPYSEDILWALNAFRNGRKIVYQPTAAAYHSHNENASRLFNRFYDESLARVSINVGTEKFRTSRLFWDAAAGTVFDMATALRSSRPLKWFLFSPIRRASINLGRYCGSRKLPKVPKLGPLAQTMLRLVLQVVEKANATLQMLAPHMVKMTRKHIEAIHPKHLLRDNESHYWYSKHLNNVERLLDLGCNQGMHSLFSSQYAKEVVGMDNDPQALYVAEFNAKWEGRKNISFLVSTLEKALPFENASFDAVIAFDVIEHLKNREEFLSEIHRVLRPCGTLLLSAPNSETTFKRLKKAAGMRYYSDPTHEIEYTRAELIAECSSSGFACREVQSVVLDTPFYGLFDFIGGLSLPLYEKLDRYKRTAVVKRPDDTTGFRLVLVRQSES